MRRLTIPEAVIDSFEDRTQLWGKRTRDLPPLAAFRVEFRSRFYRAAELNAAIALFNAYLALDWHLLIAWAVLPVNIGGVLFAESRAWMLNRQLNRRAAEQLLRDLNEIEG